MLFEFVCEKTQFVREYVWLRERKTENFGTLKIKIKSVRYKKKTTKKKFNTKQNV